MHVGFKLKICILWTYFKQNTLLGIWNNISTPHDIETSLNINNVYDYSRCSDIITGFNK